MSIGNDVAIVAAGRTGVGSFNGTLANTPAHELGATVIKALLAKTDIDPASVNEVILGQVLTGGAGQCPARQASMHAGLPIGVPAMNINKVCGSGLKAVALAAQSIALGQADIMIAGGQESMSMAPHLLPKSRAGFRMGHVQMLDSMIYDGLTDAFHDVHMGVGTEQLAEREGVTREEQDELAAASQTKAAAAQESGRFKDEIIPVEIPQRKGDPIIFDSDEYIKPGTTAEGLAKLRPAFKKDGTITAANASGLNDGAAAVILMSAAKAQDLGLEPIAYVKAHANAGVEPLMFGYGPVPASKRCLELAGWQASDLDLIESNEAFAAQAIAVNKGMGWDTSKVNVNGGAIAIGHPIGASGCRVFVTLLHEMLKRDAKKGLSTLCVGGGMGVALAVER